MARYVALLRAVNVAGHARVRMSVVREAFRAAGAINVRTHIQSGNVLFEAARASVKSVVRGAGRSLAREAGEMPEIILRPGTSLTRLVESLPFGQVEPDDEVKRYIVFLSRKPRTTPDFPLISDSEALEITGMRPQEVFVISRRKKSGFYGFPNRFVERTLGVRATSRNLSTVIALARLIKNDSA